VFCHGNFEFVPVSVKIMGMKFLLHPFTENVRDKGNAACAADTPSVLVGAFFLL
jgi:hypothetical protein